MTETSALAATDSPRIHAVLGMIAALERGEHGAALERFFTPDAVQTEYPSLLDPRTRSRGLDGILAGSEAATRLLRRHRYEVRRVLEQGDLVVLQAEWFGELAVPLGDVPAGGTLHTHSVLVYRFEAERIAGIECYDAYDPLPTAA